MGQHRSFHLLTFTLVIIGGLNWLLLGVFSWEIGDLFGGSGAIISRIIYILVGLSAIYELATHCKRCRECRPDMPAGQTAGMGMGK